MTRLGREHLGDMSDEGSKIRARRERLGMDKKALAEEAGVNRNTLAAIESGESFNRSSLAKLERALDQLELEAGIHAPPQVEQSEPRLFTVSVTDPFGLTIVTSGPMENADAVKRQVVDIIREIRRAEKKDDPDA